MEAIPTKDRESYAEGMARLRSQQSIELTAPLQNSIEIGQTSKKEWYIKSIKCFFGNSEEDRLSIIGRLFSLKDRAEAILKG